MNRPSNPVLVVEDHDDTREMVERFLRQDGYEVRTASGGAEALASVERGMPCLILLDVMMPEMDGMTFAQRLRESANPEVAATPIVLLTAFPVTREMQELVGAVAVIRKPFSYYSLTKIVGQHCGISGGHAHPTEPS